MAIPRQMGGEIRETAVTEALEVFDTALPLLAEERERRIKEAFEPLSPAERQRALTHMLERYGQGHMLELMIYFATLLDPDL